MQPICRNVIIQLKIIIKAAGFLHEAAVLSFLEVFTQSVKKYELLVMYVCIIIYKLHHTIRYINICKMDEIE